jgi:short-subunit dehydrogenase
MSSGSAERILITGATGGIGAALARAYSAPGRTLFLHGRDAARMQEVARQCRARGAEVHAKLLDVRDTAALLEWLGTLAPDLAIVNAGVSGAAREDWNEVAEILEVNVRGAIATVHGVLPAMRARGRGQIALVSSLAAWYGLPATPAYSASKAALKAYGEALRPWLAPLGIRVSVVLPGFVRTGMTERFRGPKAFMIEPEQAARRIVRGLARDRARIVFPLGLALAMRLLAALPPALAGRLLVAAGYGGR